jgi:hypothetical protein
MTKRKRQDGGIALVVAGKSPVGAASAAHVHSGTLKRWRRLLELQTAYLQIRRAVLSQARGVVEHTSVQASAVLLTRELRIPAKTIAHSDLMPVKIDASSR